MKTESKVKILFKSGNSIELWFTEFDIKYNDHHLEEVNWKCLTERQQRPIWFNVLEVEGVFVLEQREVEGVNE